MTKARPWGRPLLVAAALLPAGVLAQGANAPALGKPAPAARAEHSDRKFIEDAVQGGLAEVELGQLAQQRAADAQVKAFGVRMVLDHGQANEDLQRLAASTGVPMPVSADPAQHHRAEQLAGLSGHAFDLAYMKHMVEDHLKDVAAFEQAARAAIDPAVRAFAAKTLPVLQAHLLQARTTYDALRKRAGPEVIAAPR